MVHLERAGCTLPWTSHWMQTTMGHALQKCWKAELMLELRVQPKIG